MKPTAFLLLVTFGLSAGPHPCHAGMAGPAGESGGGKATPSRGGSPDVTLEQRSCHGAAAPAVVPAAESVAYPAAKSAPRDCCGEGDRALCERACSSVAVLSVEPPAVGLPAAQELAAVPAVRSPACLAFRIDHVPLA